MEKFQTYKSDLKVDSKKKYLNNSERLTLIEQNLMLLQELVIRILEDDTLPPPTQVEDDVDIDVEEDFPESPDSKKVKK